jgi:endonuclease/exonuclease/phosphatase family metal-dependent hydrolase
MADPFRVITYNIRKGKGADGRSAIEMSAVGKALSDHNVDLLLCQEVFHCSRSGNSQSGNLAAAMGLSSYYGANKFRVVGHHGNTTFTRFSVERFVNHDISTNRIERRGALYVRLSLDRPAPALRGGAAQHSTPLHVFNVHLGLNRWQRISQIRQIAQLVEELSNADDPVLLAGDFNDWNRELDRLITQELGFHNAFGAHEPQAARTWHARRPVFALDRIYTRHLDVTRAARLDGDPWSDLSDHLPLYAELQPV